MKPSNKKEIKDFFEKLLSLAKIKSTVSVIEEGSTTKVEIKTVDEKDGNALIGRGGEVVGALEQILKAVFKKEKNQNFFLDVNGYLKAEEEKLKKEALELARWVKDTKKEALLGPLSARKRRVVHLFLKDKGVATQSIGEEPDRKIIISPKAE